MKTADEFYIFFIIIAFLIYQSSSWFRLDEETYRKRYEKSQRFFRFMNTQKDYLNYRKREKKLFFFYIAMLLLLIYFLTIRPSI